LSFLDRFQSIRYFADDLQFGLVPKQCMRDATPRRKIIHHKNTD
jgi:hypothetical protein